MKGLELSRRYYLEYGEEMLTKSFAELLPMMAIGLVGSGSECLGYDDDISKDHDFEPGFCIFIPDDEAFDSKTVFALERAYAKLPKSFMGFDRCNIAPVGARRHGVIKVSDFLLEHTGTADGDINTEGWLALPEYALAEAVGGEIFRDDSGYFSSIRERIAYYPRDIWLKKLAGELLLMGQAGQYNYYRCISREQTGAAQLAVIEFARAAMQSIFILNKKYMPYYKWSFRAMRELETFSELADSLEFLISSDNRGESAKLKYDMIEDIAAIIIKRVREDGLSDGICNDLEKHAYSINDKIENNILRNRNILCAV